jgi:hypothetical protein
MNKLIALVCFLLLVLPLSAQAPTQFLVWNGLRWAVTAPTAGIVTQGLMSMGSGPPTVQLGTAGPTWTSGTGAPIGACIVGSLYSRTDGAAGSTLYVCQGPSGTWTAK